MTKDVFCRDNTWLSRQQFCHDKRRVLLRQTRVRRDEKKKEKKFCREQIVIVSVPAYDTDSFRELSEKVLRARHVNSEMFAPHETVQRVRIEEGRVSCDVK